MELFRATRLEALFSHDSRDPMPAPGLALLTKQSIDPRRAVDAVGFTMGFPDLDRDRFILEDATTRLAVEPGVEPTAGDLQDFAHLAYPEGLPVLLDEPELHFWSSAK